ncbi:uncharacterized protein LOC143880197 isoform X2 [Tasmannia lanceolata]|uniref:uncharacterized protein LOC143880197 isoform X2 n=1 Tax=Tasmannia lanceolata TaxID=3420 RepID=UPI0040641684
MLGLGFMRNLKSPPAFLFPSLVSFISVSLSQFSLAMVPFFFASSSLLSMLAISVLVFAALLFLSAAVFGRCFRQLLGISASAPAFVFFNVLFIWGVYLSVIRQGIPSLEDVVFNAECALLMIGLYSILSSDPGLVADGYSCLDRYDRCSFSEDNPHFVDEELSTNSAFCEQLNVMIEENAPLSKRVRYCNICKAYIRGFDHHCPAFGNCIGQNNYLLFMALLVGFVITEVSYVVYSAQFIMKSQNMQYIRLENSLSGNLAISTMLFSLLQVLWQSLILVEPTRRCRSDPNFRPSLF